MSSAKALFLSVSYEEDYINLARILVESGVEPSREMRKGKPLVIVGGPAPSANPMPLSEIADIISIGEGEGTIDQIADFATEYSGVMDEKAADVLSNVDGVFLPGFSHQKVRFAFPGEIGAFPMSVIVTDKTVFSGMVLMEISRGCPGNCGFCLASALYNPLRILSEENFTRQIEGIPPNVRGIGLVSTSIAAHPDFEKIVELSLDKGLTPSFSSLRAEDIDERKAILIAKAGTKSVSLAPESGSEKMRRRLGKNVPDSSYFEAARLLRESGIKRFNLYMLSGYPGENEEVFEQTEGFLDEFERSVSGGRVSIHLNVLVPKALTPLQFYCIPGINILGKRLSKMEKICEQGGRRVRTKSLRGAFRQAVLSLGGRDAGRAVVEYARGGVSWKRALKNCGLDPEFIHHERGIKESLPWDMIELPVKRSILLSRYYSLKEGV